MSVRRLKVRNGLSTLYARSYDALCVLLRDQWQPYSGFRCFEDQDRLWEKGRVIPPLGPEFCVTDAKGGQSAHNYGCATDWTLFDQNGAPIWLKKDDPVWEEFGEAVVKVGLRWGKEFGDVDHCELPLNCSWHHILISYDVGGMISAQQKIEDSIVKR